MNMSVSKWAYEPSECDGGYCCGECDNCYKKFMHLKHVVKRETIIWMISQAVETTVDKLNELQEQRAIKKERSLFE